MNHGLVLTAAILLPAPAPVSWGFLCLFSALRWIFSSSHCVLENRLPCEVCRSPSSSGDTTWRADPPTFWCVQWLATSLAINFADDPIDVSCFITPLYLGSSISKIRIMTPLQSALRVMDLTYQHLGYVFLLVSYWPSWNSLWCCKKKKLKFIYPWGSYCS